MDVVIISKVIAGIRPNPFGMDKGFNIFKKSLSEKFKANLDQALKENSMDYSVSIDKTYANIDSFIQNDAKLVLISPYVKEYVNVNNMSANNYYILSEKEFNDGYTKDIITFLKQTNNEHV